MKIKFKNKESLISRVTLHELRHLGTLSLCDRLAFIDTTSVIPAFIF